MEIGRGRRLEKLRFSDYCANCRRSLAAAEKVLFVEKEIGRCFCCNECITEYFLPIVESMQDEWRKLRVEDDFSEHEIDRYNHYAQPTLEDPDEIWVNQSETGERHYTFISHYRSGEERMSFVVVCLAIEEVPSFVFFSFPTRSDELVAEYRRGSERRADASNAEDEERATSEPRAVEERSAEAVSFGRSEFKRLYAELRQAGDVPEELFYRFEPFVEKTIEDPDEIWRFRGENKEEWFTFIAKQSLAGGEEERIDEFDMVVVCAAVGPAFEVVFAAPTVDPGLVQYFRKGINSLNKAFGVGWTRRRVA